ncbi:MAG: DUF6648 family protein [Anaerococcus sp.]|nr:hypothetical protein [Anaerococcus sp.]MDD7044134.1 hypothetical protein [Peptoniphilaceae bacterium]MDY2918815.1 DUF6648 family protein [Anaerococcus sp.]
MNIEDSKLEIFEKWRKESIDLLDKAEISKDEFLSLNYDFFVKLGLKPFSKITTLSQAIFNYQYYNVMAKKSNLEAKAYLNSKKKKKYYNKLINDRENYYYLKDLATNRLLELLDYKNVDCYYINLKSKRLSGLIYEINVLDRDRLVLHSKNKKILEKLKEKKCFCEDERTSVIDSYVNKSY